MKFFTTGAHKSNTPLYTAFGFFILFLILFWAGSFIYFETKYTFTAQGISEYFFGPEDFPSPVTFSQLTEEIHIGLFLTSILLLSISGFILHSRLSFSLKTILISLLFISGLIDNLSGFLIINSSRESAVLKLISFFLFQFFMVVSIMVIAIDYMKGNMSQRSQTFTYYNTVIFLFGILSLAIAFVNFYLFKEKLGFSPTSIFNYYNGNEELLINPKTMAGMVEVAVPHFAAIGIFLVSLTHFITFTPFGLKNLLIWLLFLSALTDIFSSFGVRFISDDFAILKLMSFFTFQLFLMFSAVVLIYYSVQRKVFSGDKPINN